MPIINGYTVYFYANKSKSCLLYFSIDGTSKAKALQLGRGIAKLWEDYYASFGWKTKITVKVEEYKPNK
jgi:hypothetical protein